MRYLKESFFAPNQTFVQSLAALSLGACVLGTSAFAQSAAKVEPFGNNVLVFTPAMPTSQIQAAVDAVSAKQVSNQFGTERYSLLFAPGVYGVDTPLIINVGFYTEVAGLGATPGDVTINGHVDVYNQCDQNGCTALDNFWRSLSNLTINVQGLGGCQGSADFWAVSQAAPMRRVNIKGANLSLQDYCSAGPQYASGGFIADTQLGYVINGSQQQFLMRNDTLTGWSNGVWNQVFSGVNGAPPQGYPNPPYTTLATTPVSREKPYLFVNSKGKYGVFVPSAQKNSTGPAWAAAVTPGRTMQLEDFFVATPANSTLELNLALQQGKSLILTPGVYLLSEALRVQHADTLIFGMGDATLVPQNGTAAIDIADVDGALVSGIIVDAGPLNSGVLLKVGSNAGEAHRTDPITIQDVFFRIGGATPGSATTSLEVNSNDVLLDDIWAWRADHGNGVGWTQNTGQHGVVVNGNRVTALGLAVEHYQKQQVIWNGNDGETIFYQSELPYDVPSQSAWKDGRSNGFPSYVVADSVNKHLAYGLGVYSYFNQGIDITEDNAITVPVANGVTVHDAGTVFLNGSGQIKHVINGAGPAADTSNIGTEQQVVQYP